MSDRRPCFWPLFVVALFVVNIGLMAAVITIAVRTSSSLAEPPAAAETSP